MTELEKLRTRIIIAKSIRVSPDSIEPIKNTKASQCGLYSIDFRGNLFCVGFEKVPTIEESREEIKDMYLCAIEWEFEEEFYEELDEDST
jgi:hypothetical protein